MGRTSGCQKLGSLAATLGNLVVGNGTLWQVLAKSGSDDNVLTEDSAQPLDMSFQAPASSTGKIVQQVRASDNTVQSSATDLTWDDTIPQQSSDGASLLTASITPTSTDNYIVIQFDCFASASVGGHWNVAVYRDAIENAIWAKGNIVCTNTDANSIRVLHYLQAPSTSAQTYKVFAGLNPVSGGTLYMNANNAGTRRFGGVAYGTLILTEIEA